MGAKVKLPGPDELGKIIGGLIGSAPKVSKAKSPLRALPSAPLLASEFMTPDGDLAAYLVVDMEFACRSGAALTLIPSNVADENISKPDREHEVFDNYREIANVLTAAFSVSDTRLILRDSFGGSEALPDKIKTLTRKAKTRLDLQVEIPGYGPGKLTLLAT